MEADGGPLIFITRGLLTCQTNPVVTFQFPEFIVTSGLGSGTVFTLTSWGLKTILERPNRALWNFPSLIKDT